MAKIEKVGYNRYRVALPSGEEAVLRKIGLDAVVLSEDGDLLPNQIRAMVVQQLQAGEATGHGVGGTIEVKADELGQWGKLVEMVTRKSFVSPRIVDNPSGPDEISYDDVPMADRLFCINWAPPPQREIDSLVSFRGEQGKPGADVSPAPDGDGLRDAT